ncbi:TATA box-binding protein-associated factor RNA polymerase I subunit A [Rhizophlyctis rosea]|uniref:TATA box-binding protein-associated factor RNA polymerase I subunit A n=1 Tax=Rhizophlyctis rosea TaxID=64517 RepID=A0AAD5S2W1_9FUNG|nr:TATA box-binding protein-associated factor RNA polymerase I subunit A [Rhizophlyctis rosea]
MYAKLWHTGLHLLRVRAPLRARLEADGDQYNEGFKFAPLTDPATSRKRKREYDYGKDKDVDLPFCENDESEIAQDMQKAEDASKLLINFLLKAGGSLVDLVGTYLFVVVNSQGRKQSNTYMITCRAFESTLFQEALKYLERSLDQTVGDPANDMFLFYYVKLLLKSGDNDKALSILKECAAINPEHPNCSRYMMHFLTHTQHVTVEMIPHAKRLLTLDPLADELTVLRPLVEALEDDTTQQNSKQIIELLANRLDYEAGNGWIWGRLVEHIRRGGEDRADESVWKSRRSWWPAFQFLEKKHDVEIDEATLISKAIVALYIFPDLYRSFQWMEKHNLTVDTISFTSAGLVEKHGFTVEALFAVGEERRILTKDIGGEAEEVDFDGVDFDRLLRERKELWGFLEDGGEGFVEIGGDAVGGAEIEDGEAQGEEVDEDDVQRGVIDEDVVQGGEIDEDEKHRDVTVGDSEEEGMVEDSVDGSEVRDDDQLLEEQTVQDEPEAEGEWQGNVEDQGHSVESDNCDHVSVSNSTDNVDESDDAKSQSDTSEGVETADVELGQGDAADSDSGSIEW